MPGENCAVFGCGSSRRKKGIGIWKLPKAKDESYAKCRDEWLGEIKKTRDLDQSFKELIKNDRVFTCEKHFAAEDVEICKYGTGISYDLRHDMFTIFASFGFLFSPSCSIVSNYVLFLLLFFVVLSEKQTKKMV